MNNVNFQEVLSAKITALMLLTNLGFVILKTWSTDGIL